MPSLTGGPKIGVLGGSFNPAHRGHLHISRCALERLGLDEVWWLVSPQNPLKSTSGMAPMKERLASARGLAAGWPIKATDIESRLGTRYTADTLVHLKMQYPGVRFVWLMGADLLLQIPRWRKWSSIFHTVPVAVFARPPYSLRAETAKAARRFARFRIKPYRAKRLAEMRPPAWVYLKTPSDPTSATEIRGRTGGASRDA